MSEPRVYRPEDQDVRSEGIMPVLDGQVIWDAFAACPEEGWVDVWEDQWGENRDPTAPILLVNGEKVPKRLHGFVEMRSQEEFKPF